VSFSSDDFTDSAGTVLSSHTPSGGGSWARNPTAIYAGIDVVVAANRVRIAQRGSTAYYHGGAPASADYDVSADIYVASASSVAGAAVVGRQSTSDGSGYAFGTLGSSGLWNLYRVGTTGGVASLGTFSDTISTGTTRAIKLEMRGTTIKGYVDGTAVVTATNSTVTAAGKAAVRFNSNNTDGGDSLYYHLDNFDASDPAGGGMATAYPASILFATF
jgi:hypothetical protein